MSFIQIEQLKLHYEHQSKGDIPIIFLHGNFGSWHYWQHFLQEMPTGYCGYAPDFRGCGDSEVTENGYDIKTLSSDIIQFADRLQIDKFHLVGHSLGGAVAQELAGNAPERILTLTLVAPVPAEGLLSVAKAPDGFFSAKNIFNFLDTIKLKRSFLSATFKKTMPGLKNKTSALNTVLDDALQMDSKAFNGFLNTLKSWKGIHLLPHFNFPVLIMHGELDSVIPLEPLKTMQQEISDCRFHAFRHIGHSPQLEDPKAFNKLLTAFLQGQKIEAAIEPSLEKTLNIFSQLKVKIKSLFK